jgi:hypothetical protein
MKPFEVSAVVVPANNGTLQKLGFDVKALQTKALGIVIEAKSGKALVQFPELRVNVWLSHSEIKDVLFESQNGNAEYSGLVPKAEDFAHIQSAYNIVWWGQFLFSKLEALYLWDVALAPTADQLFEDDDDFEPKNFAPKANLNQSAAVLRLGVSELDLNAWTKVQSQLGDKLLFARFLPAGLQKIEIAVCLAHWQLPAQDV